MLVGVSEGVGVTVGVEVAEGVDDGRIFVETAIPVSLSLVAKVAVTAAGDVAACWSVAACWLDEQAANPTPINRLVKKIAAAFTILPINRECTRKLVNTGNLIPGSKSPQISKQSLIFEPGFTGKIG